MVSAKEPPVMFLQVKRSLVTTMLKSRESLDNNTGRWVRSGGALGRCPGRWVALGGGLGRCPGRWVALGGCLSRCCWCPVPSVSGVTPRWPVADTPGEHISKSLRCIDVF